ncbi:hypothetical protein DQ384_24185 [Sphaerisporangium album]|uniref:Protein kinase domain-containing protein n=1 Tax=Sphaerisporangium album TaxID=509200 RepID=A0A367FD16_9ACTN|nr:hypothetical protein [Sphaerisporangium album]RCG28234.1 hypothetical protein DQ384_24185 [Sphaerisporangium album]
MSTGTTRAGWPSVPQRLKEAEIRHAVPGSKGGASTVFTAFGYADRLMYKKYTEPRDPAALDRLVELHAAMDAESAGYARDHMAWPVATVRAADGQVAGLMVIRADMTFHAHLSTSRVRVRDFNYLLYEDRAARVGVPPATVRQKAALLRDLVSVLLWLDERGLVHEDLAAHNVLWRLEPEATVFLLDCDSLRPAGEATGQPLFTTVDWTDPRVLGEEVARPDRASTSYAVGLLVARVLGSPYWRPASGEGSIGPGGGFPPALEPLLDAAVGPAANRPSLRTWLDGIDGIAGALPAVRRVREAPPTPPATLRVEGQTIGLNDRLALLAGLVIGALAAVLVMVRFL